MRNDTTAFPHEDYHPLTRIYYHCSLCCDDRKECREKDCELWPFRNGYLEGVVRYRPEHAIYAYCQRCADESPDTIIDCARAPLAEEPCLLWSHRDPFSASLELMKRKLAGIA